MRLLILDWPEVQYTINQVFAYVTDGLTGTNGAPLLHHALLGALDDYEQSVIRRLPDRDRLRAFLDRLFGCISRATACAVLVSRDGARWRAPEGVPMQQWLIGRDPGLLTLEFCDDDPAGNVALTRAALDWFALQETVRKILGFPDPGHA